MSSLNVPIRIKRGVGAPATLKQGELAFDESGQRLFIGSGVGSGGNAASVVELTTPPAVLEDLANISVGSGASDGDVLVYDSATGDWVAEALSIAWDSVTSKPSFATVATTGAYSDLSGAPASLTPDAHKASHATGGTDALSPADIGAAASSHTHSDATTSVAGFLSASDKTKLDGIASGAEVNVQSDWNASSGDAQILNKPSLSTVATSGDYTDLENIPSTFTPASHAHGNITNAGRVGSTSGLPLKTGTDGIVEAGAFGTSAGQFAEGNHSHAWTDITSKPSTFTPAAHNHTVTLEISGFIESPEAKTYVISPAIPAAITITQLKAQTSAGTVDLAVHDDGTLVTGCSLADAGTTLASLASAISESVAAGSKLALVVSDLQSSPADLAFSVHYTVASANNS